MAAFMVLQLLLYVCCVQFWTQVYVGTENVSAAETRPKQEKMKKNFCRLVKLWIENVWHKPEKQKFANYTADLMEGGREGQRQSRKKKTQKLSEIAGFHQ